LIEDGYKAEEELLNQKTRDIVAKNKETIPSYQKFVRLSHIEQMVSRIHSK
jgi:hypothetical protein